MQGGTKQRTRAVAEDLVGEAQSGCGTVTSEALELKGILTLRRQDDGAARICAV